MVVAEIDQISRINEVDGTPIMSFITMHTAINTRMIVYLLLLMVRTHVLPAKALNRAVAQLLKSVSIMERPSIAKKNPGKFSIRRVNPCGIMLLLNADN